MRYLFGFVFACALGVSPLSGCSETGGDGGNGGSGGTGGTDQCEGVTCEDTECRTDGVCDPTDGVCDYTLVDDGTACTNGECLDGVCAPAGAFPCTAEGIRDAIATGGGPHFFACDGSTPVVTGEIIIDNDVVLDGQGKLTVDGDEQSRVFAVPDGVTAELRGFTVTRGAVRGSSGGGIQNKGTLTLVDTTVSRSSATCSSSCIGGLGIGGGILNGLEDATLTLVNSTVSGNTASFDGAGVWNSGTMTATNSTVSGNDTTRFGAGGIYNMGMMMLVNGTVTGSNSGGEIGNSGTMTVKNSLVQGECSHDVPSDFTSAGYNVESPGDTCGFDQSTDQPNVSALQLNLGPLEDSGGPTETHEPGGGEFGTDSVAIDQVPEADCVDADGAPLRTDQRGEPRPAGPESECDVGSFEVQEGGQ